LAEEAAEGSAARFQQTTEADNFMANEDQNLLLRYGQAQQAQQPQAGPFSPYLSIDAPIQAYLNPRAPQTKMGEREFSGWESGAGIAAGVASKILSGAQTARMNRFIKQEEQRRNSMAMYENYVRSIMSDPNYTQEAKDKIRADFEKTLAAQVYQDLDKIEEFPGQEGKGKGKGKGKGGGNPVVNFIKQMAVNMTGGELPHKGPIDFRSKVGEYQNILYDPSANVNVAVQQMQQQLNQKIEEYRRANNGMEPDQPTVQQFARDIGYANMSRVGREGVGIFYAGAGVGYDPRLLMAEEAHRQYRERGESGAAPPAPSVAPSGSPTVPTETGPAPIEAMYGRQIPANRPLETPGVRTAPPPQVPAAAMPVPGTVPAATPVPAATIPPAIRPETAEEAQKKSTRKPSPFPVTSDQQGKIREMVAQAATKYGLDPNEMKALASVESNFQNVYGSEIKGKPYRAFGPMQLIPETAEKMGVNRMDIGQNIDGGVRYFKEIQDKFSSPEYQDSDLVRQYGTKALSYMAYYAGPEKVEKMIQDNITPPPSYVDYAQKIMDRSGSPVLLAMAGQTAPQAEAGEVASDIYAGPRIGRQVQYYEDTNRDRLERIIKLSRAEWGKAYGMAVSDPVELRSPSTKERAYAVRVSGAANPKDNGWWDVNTGQQIKFPTDWLPSTRTAGYITNPHWAVDPKNPDREIHYGIDATTGTEVILRDESGNPVTRMRNTPLSTGVMFVRRKDHPGKPIPVPRGLIHYDENQMSWVITRTGESVDVTTPQENRAIETLLAGLNKDYNKSIEKAEKWKADQLSRLKARELAGLKSEISSAMGRASGGKIKPMGISDKTEEIEAWIERTKDQMIAQAQKSWRDSAASHMVNAGWYSNMKEAQDMAVGMDPFEEHTDMIRKSMPPDPETKPWGKPYETIGKPSSEKYVPPENLKPWG
jgi:soluble lytic murein transglycosylase-like protein